MEASFGENYRDLCINLHKRNGKLDLQMSNDHFGWLLIPRSITDRNEMRLKVMSLIESSDVEVWYWFNNAFHSSDFEFIDNSVWGRLIFKHSNAENINSLMRAILELIYQQS